MDIESLARRHLQDYLARQPGTCFGDPDFRLDLEPAYALQAEVTKLRVAAGDRVIGYKVGCTGAGTVSQFGMAGPIRGCLFDSEIQEDHAELAADAFAALAIEGEMALRLGADGAIAAAFPVIELHHFVFRGGQKTLAELVANNGLNGGIVMPDAQWQSSQSYIKKPGTLGIHINGQQIGLGDLWPMAGGPAASLDWLSAHLGNAGQRLQPGQIILAGTPLGLYPVQPGDRITVLVDGQVGVRCSVT
jgi:2-keto-4-pentenoate hydratase